MNKNLRTLDEKCVRHLKSKFRVEKTQVEFLERKAEMKIVW